MNQKDQTQQNRAGLDRRDFLKGVGAGALLGAARWAGAEETPAPAETGASEGMRYRRLGRTNLMVSEISLGTVFGGDPSRIPIVRHCLDVGINYIDTCGPEYGSEGVIGEGIKGKREQVILATKWHPVPGSTKEQLLAEVEGSLQRLQTDYLDLMQVHDVNDFERFVQSELFAAMDQARQDGKVRFFGATCHNPGVYDSVMTWVVESGLFDMLLATHHVALGAPVIRLAQLCARHDVGFVAMKTLAGGQHADLQSFQPDERTTFPQAAMKWALSHPGVSCLVKTMTTFQEVDEYVQASGKRLTAEDRRVLDRYVQLVDHDLCRWCQACLPCPEEVAIPDILRYAMYFRHYRQEKRAMGLYAGLGGTRWANRCTDCGECVKRCPYGLPVRDKLREAHGLLA